MKKVDMTGKRCGKLTVLEQVEGVKPVTWKCLCDCGNITIVRGGNLRSGGVKSCGCAKFEKHSTHHLSQTRLYRKWVGMKRRCYDTQNAAYNEYGGRGITMCDEWKADFLAFREWALKTGYEDGLSIERIDVNKGYCPENCKWLPISEQANNRRTCLMFEYNGKTQNLTQWCKEFNVNYKLVNDRIKQKGWSFERAMFTPVDVKKRNKKSR